MLLLVLAAQAREAEPNLKVKSFTRVQLGAHLLVETEGDDAGEVSSVTLSGAKMARSGLVYGFESALKDSASPDAGWEFLLSGTDWPMVDGGIAVCDALPCDWTLVGGDRRGAVEARVVDATLEVQVAVHDDALIADLVDKDDLKLSWSSTDGEKGNNEKPAAVAALWDATIETKEESATVSLVAYDDKGSAADSLTETVSVVGSGEAIEQITLTELDHKQYALGVITSADGGAQVVSGTVIDGDEVLMSAGADLPLQVERQFAFKGLKFESDPTGETYRFTLHLTGRDGEVESVSGSIGFQEGSASTFDWGAIRADLNDGGDLDDIESRDGGSVFDIVVAVPGDVRSVALSWGDTTGPRPGESDLKLELERVWQRWGLVFETQTPINDSVQVEVELLSPDKESLDLVSGEDDTGTIYASFGKGTTNSASSAAARPMLL